MDYSAYFTIIKQREPLAAGTEERPAVKGTLYVRLPGLLVLISEL